MQVRALLTALVLASTATLTACGGGSSDSAGDNSDAPTSSSTPETSSSTPSSSSEPTSAEPPTMYYSDKYVTKGKAVQSHNGLKVGTKFTGTWTVASPCGDVTCKALVTSRTDGRKGSSHATVEYNGKTLDYNYKPVRGACSNGGYWLYTAHADIEIVGVDDDGKISSMHGLLHFKAVPNDKARKNNCLAGTWTNDVTYKAA